MYTSFIRSGMEHGSIYSLIILVKNSNLLKFIKAKCKLGALMVYIVTYQQNTFQLQILCLKFVKVYIFLNFEPQNAVRIK